MVCVTSGPTMASTVPSVYHGRRVNMTAVTGREAPLITQVQTKAQPNPESFLMEDFLCTFVPRTWRLMVV